MNLIVISSKVCDKFPETWKATCGHSDFIVADCSSAKNVFEEVAICGLELEKHLIVDGKTLLWDDTPKYKAAGMVWGLEFALNFPKAIEIWPAPRGDEVIFNSLAFNTIKSWALGNPRSIIKWAACALHLPDIEYPLFPQSTFDPNHSQNQTSRFVWVSYRIGLKPYGYE